MNNELIVIQNTIHPGELIYIYEITEQVCKETKSKKKIGKYIIERLEYISFYKYKICVTRKENTNSERSRVNACQLRYNDINIYLNKTTELVECFE